MTSHSHSPQETGAVSPAPVSLRSTIARFSAPANWALIACGIVILFLLVAIAWLSPAFFYGSRPDAQTVLFFFSLLTIAGVIYLFLFFIVPRAKPDKRYVVLALLIGGISRACFFGSTPIYEDDWYRYLWDGAVFSAGVNPYLYPPADALPDLIFGDDPIISGPKADIVLDLAQHHDDFPDRVAYPYITTIYPPVAQLGFAAAHQIKPFNLDAWRAVLFATDLLALFVLLRLLHHFRKSPFWVLVYWWNPLLILTAFNAGHMDILLVPFLASALLLSLKERPRLSAVALGCAAGVKLWPIMLAPLLFRQWRTKPFALISIGVCFAAALGVFVLPMIISLEPQTSGLSAYANEWIRNAFIFPLLVSVFDTISFDGDLIARFTVAGLTVSFIVYCALFGKNDPNRVPCLMLAATAMLFFLSPTGYSWYAIWLFMFLPFVPSFGIAVLTLTLPIYYLRFYFNHTDRADFFNNVLTPVEFGIPLVVLAITYARRVMKSS